MKGHQYKTLLSGLLAVAVAFGIALPLGYWLRPYAAVSDVVFGAMLAVVLVGIACGVMRLLAGPLWQAKKIETSPNRFPDLDLEPDATGSAAGRRTGYELNGPGRLRQAGFGSIVPTGDSALFKGLVSIRGQRARPLNDCAHRGRPGGRSSRSARANSDGPGETI